MNEKKLNYYKQLYPESRFPHIAYSITLTIGILILTGIAEALITYQIPEENKKDIVPVVIGFGQLIFMLIPTYFAASQSPLSIIELFRLRKYSEIKHYGIAISGLLAIQLFISCYISFQEHLVPDSLMNIYNLMKNEFEKIYSDLLGGTSIAEALRALAIGALIPALCEELLFRGFLQRSLEERLKPLKAIFLTSAIFSVIHFNPINMIPLFIIGVYFGIIAYLTNSLVIPIILHFLNNFFAIIILYIPALQKINEESFALSVASSLLLTLVGLILSVMCILKIYRDSNR